MDYVGRVVDHIEGFFAEDEESRGESRGVKAVSAAITEVLLSCASSLTTMKGGSVEGMDWVEGVLR